MNNGLFAFCGNCDSPLPIQTMNNFTKTEVSKLSPNILCSNCKTENKRKRRRDNNCNFAAQTASSSRTNIRSLLHSPGKKRLTARAMNLIQNKKTLQKKNS